MSTVDAEIVHPSLQTIIKDKQNPEEIVEKRDVGQETKKPLLYKKLSRDSIAPLVMKMPITQNSTYTPYFSDTDRKLVSNFSASMNTSRKF